jgi:hypothetical protein
MTPRRPRPGQRPTRPRAGQTGLDRGPHLDLGEPPPLGLLGPDTRSGDVSRGVEQPVVAAIEQPTPKPQVRCLLLVGADPDASRLGEPVVDEAVAHVLVDDGVAVVPLRRDRLEQAQLPGRPYRSGHLLGGPPGDRHRLGQVELVTYAREHGPVGRPELGPRAGEQRIVVVVDRQGTSKGRSHVVRPSTFASVPSRPT